MATVFVITCTNCGKRFKGKETLQGKKLSCPFCKEIFLVAGRKEPAAGSAPQSAKGAGQKENVAAAIVAAKSELNDDDKFYDRNPYDITELDLTPRCPNCANELASEEAVICLYCGYNTQTRAWGRTEKVVAHTGGERFLWLLPGLLSALGFVALTVFLIFYCLGLPAYVQGSWMRFMDHESMRMWLTVMLLFPIWIAGRYAFNRLALHPIPPDKVKD
jgi:hypothetical protein